MPVGVLFELPGVTEAQYEEVCKRLNNGQPLRSLSEWPNRGVLSHAAGPTPNGWRVLDVWESEADFQKTVGILAPIMKEVGLPDVPPQIFPVHNFVNR